MVLKTGTVLITGSSHGIGLAVAAQWKRLGWRVIGTTHNVDTAQKLRALTPYKILSIDVEDEASIMAAAAAIVEPIDILLHTAHVSEINDLRYVSKSALMKQFELLAITPLLVTRAFVPHLKMAATQNGSAWITRICYINDAALVDNVHNKRYLGDLAQLASVLITKNLVKDPTNPIRVTNGVVVADPSLQNGTFSAPATKQILDMLWDQYDHNKKN